MVRGFDTGSHFHTVSDVVANYVYGVAHTVGMNGGHRDEQRVAVAAQLKLHVGCHSRAQLLVRILDVDLSSHGMRTWIQRSGSASDSTFEKLIGDANLHGGAVFYLGGAGFRNIEQDTQAVDSRNS